LSSRNKNSEKKLKFYFEKKDPELKNNTFRKKNPEKKLLYFGNENPKTKMKNSFRIKKSII